MEHHVYYFYVIDENNKLKGVLSTRDILFNSPHVTLASIAHSQIISLHEKDTVEEALKILTEHHLLALPIIDDFNRLIGMFEIIPQDINLSSKLKKTPSKEALDLFQMLTGLTLERGGLDSKWGEYRQRMPWLMGNILAGLACAAIAAYHHLTLSHFIVLSLFIPLVLTLAESTAMQSMTLSLRFLKHRRIFWPQVFKRVFHEWSVAFFLGGTSALLLGIYYLFAIDTDWYPDRAMVVVSSSIFLSMIIAATYGTLFPLLLHKMNLDPKVAAGPVVLMITDVTATALYLGFATYLLNT